MVTMANREQMEPRQTSGKLTCQVGAGVAVFSLLAGLIIFFTPSSCSFIGSIQLLMLAFLFIAGLITLISGLPSYLKARTGRR